MPTPEETLEDFDDEDKLDLEVVELVEALNKLGIKTFDSCWGHPDEQEQIYSIGPNVNCCSGWVSATVTDLNRLEEFLLNVTDATRGRFTMWWHRKDNSLQRSVEIKLETCTDLDLVSEHKQMIAKLTEEVLHWASENG